MTDNRNSTHETTTTANETTPAPKLAGDIPRARPDLIDTDTADERLLRTDDSYYVSTSGPFAGI